MKRRYGLLGVITLSLARRIPRGSSPRRSLSLNPAMANQERRIPGSVLAPLILVAIRQSFDDLGAPLALLRLYGLYDMLIIHRIYPRLRDVTNGPRCLKGVVFLYGGDDVALTEHHLNVLADRHP